MRDDGVFQTPSHIMLVKNWHYLYQRHNAGSTKALINDLKTFTTYMTRIVTQHVFPGLKKIVKKNPYQVYFEYSKDNILVLQTCNRTRSANLLSEGVEEQVDMQQHQNTLTKNNAPSGNDCDMNNESINDVKEKGKMIIAYYYLLICTQYSPFHYIFHSGIT